MNIEQEQLFLSWNSHRAVAIHYTVFAVRLRHFEVLPEEKKSFLSKSNVEVNYIKHILKTVTHSLRASAVKSLLGELDKKLMLCNGLHPIWI